MAFRRTSRIQRRTTRKTTEPAEREAAPVEEPTTGRLATSRLRTAVDERDAALADEALAGSKDFPDTGTAVPISQRGDVSATPDDLKSAVVEEVLATVTDGAPDLGDPSPGLADDAVTAPTGPDLSPSVGGDVLDAVGPDVSPSFDPRPGSVDDALGEVTDSTGLDPDAKTPDHLDHLRPDSGGTAGFVEEVAVGPDPSEQDPDEKAERDLLAELGFTDDEIDLAFDDPDAFTKLVNERADRAFLEEHGFSEAEINAALDDPDAFRASVDEAAQKAIVGREDSPNDLETEESIVRGIDIGKQMEIAREALLANGYTEEEADDLTAPPRGGFVLNDFKPKQELTDALNEIAENQEVSEEEEVVAEEEEVIVSDEEVIVSEEKIVGDEEPAQEGPIETVFVGGGAEDRGDQRIAPSEEEKTEEAQEEEKEEEQAVDQDTADSDTDNTAGSDAEDPSRTETEPVDPRIEKQARDLEEQLGAESRDPRSDAIDPSPIHEGNADPGGEPNPEITQADLAQPKPDGEDEGGGTRASNGSGSTGLDGTGSINPGPDGDGAPTGVTLDDDPVVPEIDRDREDPATTDGTGTTGKVDSADGFEPDLGSRPAVDLTAPADLDPTTGPITSSSFSVDPETGAGDGEPSDLTTDVAPTSADPADLLDDFDLEPVDTRISRIERIEPETVETSPIGARLLRLSDSPQPVAVEPVDDAGVGITATDDVFGLPVVDDLSPRELDGVLDEFDDVKLGEPAFSDADAGARDSFFDDVDLFDL